MKKENIELDYDLTLDNKFIEKVGSPFDCDFPVLGTGKSVKPIKDKKILVIRLEPCAELYALNNSVTYITDNKAKYDEFLEKVNDEKYGSDDSAILFSDWKNIDKLLEENNMKFDIIIGNPPYDKNLHLKILEKCINAANKLVWISPCTWAARHNYCLPKGAYRSKLTGKIEQFELIPHRKMNDIFMLGNAIEDGAIMVLSDKGLYDIEHHGFVNATEYSLYKKINFYKNPGCLTMAASTNGRYGGTAEMFKVNKPEFYTPLYQWHGGDSCYDACVIVDEDKIRKGCSYFKFNTLTERHNFEESLRTKFMDWFYGNYIVPGDFKERNYLFRMQDYSQPWTDKRFCEFFNITGYIDDNTAEPGSEWAMILDYVKNN